MITKFPLRYVTPGTNTPPLILYHLSVIFEVEKKNKDTDAPMTQTPMF